MKALLSALLLCLAFSVAALAQQTSYGGVSPAGLDPNGQVASSNLAYAVPRLLPVCNSNLPSDGGLGVTATSPGFNAVFERVEWCPHGAKSIAAAFSGVWTNGSSGETNLNSNIPMNLGFWPNSPPPWSPTTAYTTGAIVMWNTAVYTAAANNTGSEPTSANTANWTVTSWPGPFYSITCGDLRTCQQSAIQTPSGALQTQGLMVTDLMPAQIPAGGFLMTKGWAPLAVGAAVPFGTPMNVALGEYETGSSSAGDSSLTQPSAGAVSLAGYSYGMSPTAILGVPQTAGPTECIIGDSVATGWAGNGFVVSSGSNSITAGGTGYTNASVGVRLTIPDTGAGTYATGRLADGVSPASAVFVVRTVSGGAVTAVALQYGGSYNNPSRNAGSAMPTGSQTLVGGDGSGLHVTLSAAGVGFDIGDQYGGLGYVQRGLDASPNAGAYVAFTRAGDTMQEWTAASYNARIGEIGRVGCSSVIIEPGVNDLAGGATAAQLEGYATSLANRLLQIPSVRAVYLATVTPDDTSTDGFETTTNQTDAIGTPRKTYNTWVRGIPSPFAGIFDAAALVESSNNSGFWIAGGSVVCLYTCDGLHPTPYGSAQAAAAISNNARILK